MPAQHLTSSVVFMQSTPEQQLPQHQHCGGPLGICVLTCLPEIKLAGAPLCCWWSSHTALIHAQFSAMCSPYSYCSPAQILALNEGVCVVDVLHAQIVVNRCGCHAQDATRKQIGVGDIVDVAAGRAKGKSGTVKYIHRQGLFLHVRWAALPCSVT
jgi:hypothetical protein